MFTIVKNINYIILFTLLLFPISIGFSINNSIKTYYSNKQKPQTEWQVKVTMYNTDPVQTDSTPNITASGFIIDTLNPYKHRIIAVSHDIKKHFKYGEKVLVSGIGIWSGYYYVRDLMNKRWTNKIDILINDNQIARSFTKAKLIKLDK
jgi:3D (Asp-Asp-Asp) domain-containing protein